MKKISENAMFSIAMTIMTAVLLGAHFLMYETIVVFLAIGGPTHTTELLILRVIFFLLAVLFPLTSLATFRFNTFLTRFFYRIASWWFGTLLYALTATMLICLSVLVFGLASGSVVLAVVVFSLYGLTLALGAYGAVNASWVRITRVSIALPHLPTQWKDKRVLFLSDTHFGQVRAMGFAKKLRKTIEGLAARKDTSVEAILFGGDFYDGPAMDFQSVADEFGKIHTRLGTFFVTGNHEGYTHFTREEGSDTNTPANALRTAGIRVIDEESVDLDGIALHGAGFPASEKKEGFLLTLQGFRDLTTASSSSELSNKPKPHILLKHTPFFLEESAAAGISLELCGHTHRGQQFPFMLMTRRIFKGHDYGLSTQEARGKTMKAYTSSGVGTWGPCLRIGTKAELVLITFV